MQAEMMSVQCHVHPGTGLGQNLRLKEDPGQVSDELGGCAAVQCLIQLMLCEVHTVPRDQLHHGRLK